MSQWCSYSCDTENRHFSLHLLKGGGSSPSIPSIPSIPSCPSIPSIPCSPSSPLRQPPLKLLICNYPVLWMCGGIQCHQSPPPPPPPFFINNQGSGLVIALGFQQLDSGTGASNIYNSWLKIKIHILWYFIQWMKKLM